MFTLTRQRADRGSIYRHMPTLYSSQSESQVPTAHSSLARRKIFLERALLPVDDKREPSSTLFLSLGARTGHAPIAIALCCLLLQLPATRLCFATAIARRPLLCPRARLCPAAALLCRPRLAFATRCFVHYHCSVRRSSARSWRREGKAPALRCTVHGETVPAPGARSTAPRRVAWEVFVERRATDR